LVLQRGLMLLEQALINKDDSHDQKTKDEQHLGGHQGGLIMTPWIVK